MADISGRLEIQLILIKSMRYILSTTLGDFFSTIHLYINKLAPEQASTEPGLGEHIFLKTLPKVTGRSVPALKTTYKKIKDLGDVASSARTTQKIFIAALSASVTLEQTFCRQATKKKSTMSRQKYAIDEDSKQQLDSLMRFPVSPHLVCHYPNANGIHQIPPMTS